VSLRGREFIFGEREEAMWRCSGMPWLLLAVDVAHASDPADALRERRQLACALVATPLPRALERGVVLWEGELFWEEIEAITQPSNEGLDQEPRIRYCRRERRAR